MNLADLTSTGLRFFVGFSAFPLAASGQGVTLDSMRFQTASHYLWRGIDRGKLAGGVDASVNIAGGIDEKRFQATADFEFQRAFGDVRNRITRNHARESLTSSYHLSGEGERIWAEVAALQFPCAARTAPSSYEIGGGVMARVPWPGERRPLFMSELVRDISRYRTELAKAGLQFDYEFGNRKALFLTPSQYWSGFDPSGSTNGRHFGSSASELEIRADFDSDPATTHAVSRRLEPYINMLWSTRNHDPNIFSGGIRLTFVF